MKNMTGDEESTTGCRITCGDKASLEAGTAGCGLQPSVDKWRGELHMNGSTTELESLILEEGSQLYQGVTSSEEGTRVGIRDQDDRL